MNCASKVIQKNLTFGMRFIIQGNILLWAVGGKKVDGNLK